MRTDNKDLLVIQLANVIPRLPPRNERVGTSDSLMEDDDTDPGTLDLKPL